MGCCCSRGQGRKGGKKGKGKGEGREEKEVLVHGLDTVRVKRELKRISLLGSSYPAAGEGREGQGGGGKGEAVCREREREGRTGKIRTGLH